mgnify:CR=1 FL=1
MDVCECSGRMPSDVQAVDDADKVAAKAASSLSVTLNQLGFQLSRLKTGTPPRLDARSINFNVLEEQPTDSQPQPFSYSSNSGSVRSRPWTPFAPQVSCFQTKTNERTAEVVKAAMERYNIN